MGLGNPGARYAGSRHNVGFRVVDALARRHGISLEQERHLGHFGVAEVGGHTLGLLEPQTFMNASGEAVADALSRHDELDSARDLVVVYDDLDLETGRIRLRTSGGAGGHRGLASVLACVGKNDVTRLRLGVGRPSAEGATIDHVLGAFTAEEESLLVERIEIAVDALECWIESGPGAAMDRYNRPPNPAANEPRSALIHGAARPTESSDSIATGSGVTGEPRCNGVMRFLRRWWMRWRR